MLAISSESEAIGNHGPNAEPDHQISLPQQEAEGPPKVDQVELPNHIPSPNKQNSIFSLTLDQIQCKSGRSFGSMNMEDFIANIWSVEEIGQLTVSSPQANQLDNDDDHMIINSVTNERSHNNNNSNVSLSRQGSFSIPIPLCRKTVDEIWFDMHERESAEQLDQPENAGDSTPVPQRQQTLGEMTLEDFLVKAGVVQESLQQVKRKPGNKSADSNSNAINSSSARQSAAENSFAGMKGCCTAFAAYHPYGQSGVAGGQHHEVAGYGNGDCSINAENCLGNLMDKSGTKSKRRILDGPPEVVVERRQRRMIKNRESAARSRARKQAYTVELEVELNQLKEENEKLKQVMAEAELKRKQEVLMKRNQYSTKAQKLAEKLRIIRRAASLAW